MVRRCAPLLLCSLLGTTVAAQHNWAAVPCFELKYGNALYRLVPNEANNELILCNDYRAKVCGVPYVALFAYDGNGFHDMDVGVDLHINNYWLGSTSRIGQCVEFNGKAIVNGIFSTVGSDTLPAKYLATWNGSRWDTFPHPFWSNRDPRAAFANYGISTVLKDNGKLWLFTGYDTAGTLTFIPVLYDGSSFTPMPQIPVNVKNPVTQAVKYRDKLVVTGNFYNSPNFDWFRLAQFDGKSWSQVGRGVRGNLTGVWNMAVYKDTLYIAGNFAKADGNAGNYVMKWDGSQLRDAGFGEWCGFGPVRRLLLFKNRLYAFGGFNCALQHKAFGVAYYENGAWTVPRDSIPEGVADAAVYKGSIYIGGYFLSINGDSTLRKFARLACPDFDAASGCRSALPAPSQELPLTLYPNPASQQLQLNFDSSSTPHLVLINPLGQTLWQASNALPPVQLDVSTWPAGVYLLHARGPTQSRVFKVVVSH